MNFVLFSGNLVRDLELKQSSNGKDYTYGTIGVYQGKNENGESKPSIFFDFTCFGNDAKTLAETSKKGDLIVICGRLEEVETTSDDGRTFVHKRVICQSAKACKKYVATPQTNEYDPSIWESAK